MSETIGYDPFAHRRPTPTLREDQVSAEMAAAKTSV
jgi:hypothetical protein